MQRLPAGAAFAALVGAVAGDAVADAVDAAEFLAVDVDQLARPLSLVADDRQARIEPAIESYVTAPRGRAATLAALLQLAPTARQPNVQNTYQSPHSAPGQPV
jgi:hypothetical protein